MKTLGTGSLKTLNGLTNIISYDYLYSDQTYSGLFMSSLERIVKDKQMFIDNSIRILDKLKNKNEPYVIIEKEQDRYPGVLKTRRCISGLISSKPVNNEDYMGSSLHIIWFDDGNISIEESLMNILPEIDWDNNAKNFDY